VEPQDREVADVRQRNRARDLRLVAIESFVEVGPLARVFGPHQAGSNVMERARRGAAELRRVF
jgi:hypothetical protein